MIVVIVVIVNSIDNAWSAFVDIEPIEWMVQ